MIQEYLIKMRLEWSYTLLVILLLFIKLGRGWKNEKLLPLLYGWLLLTCLLPLVGDTEGRLFAGMFVNTPLILFQKMLLSIGVLLILLLCHDWLKRHDHLIEFLLLLFSAQLGMNLMLSAGNLLMFYLALELSTIPVAAMANFDLNKKMSSEAAMKMILTSAFSSGLLLFGISLIYGLSGTFHFGEIPAHFRNPQPMHVIAFLFFFSGLAFKLSVVPFHLWTADVYEGSPVAVTSYLSVISKGTVAFVLITFLYKVFQPLGEYIYPLLMAASVVTVLVGNLFAIRQTDMKRFLAFSSIAQVAFILLGLSAGDSSGTASVTYFVLVYVFSNLAAFGVLAVVQEATGRISIGELGALYRNNKFLGWVLAIALFSLAGIPPTAGFFGKFYLILAGAKEGNIWFVGFLVLNLVVSLYYYLRVVRSVFMSPTLDPAPAIRINVFSGTALVICTVMILVLGLFGSMYDHILLLTK